MGKHSKVENNATHIGEGRLVELRQAGRVADRGAGGFVDPYILQRCEGVLDRRGEHWAAAVLGRDITRRSLTVAHRPYLLTGEDHTLVAADAEEDRISVAHLDFAD
jgi:hypothetical protein